MDDLCDMEIHPTLYLTKTHAVDEKICTTLHETNSSPLKINGSKMFFLEQKPLFLMLQKPSDSPLAGFFLVSLASCVRLPLTTANEVS